MDGVPFSTEISRYWNRIEAWKLALKKLNGKRVQRKFLRQSFLKASIDYKDPRLKNRDFCESNLNLSWKLYLVQKKKAKQLRVSFIDMLAKAKAAEGGETIAGNIKALILMEETREQYRRI